MDESMEEIIEETLNNGIHSLVKDQKTVAGYLRSYATKLRSLHAWRQRQCLAFAFAVAAQALNLLSMYVTPMPSMREAEGVAYGTFTTASQDHLSAAIAKTKKCYGGVEELRRADLDGDCINDFYLKASDGSVNYMLSSLSKNISAHPVSNFGQNAVKDPYGLHHLLWTEKMTWFHVSDHDSIATLFEYARPGDFNLNYQRINRYQEFCRRSQH